MKCDVDYLWKCMDILENNKDETLQKIHNELKIFTPIGMDETECDIVWCKAWKTCSPEQLEHPDVSTIRKCDMLFCKLLMKKLQQ